MITFINHHPRHFMIIPDFMQEFILTELYKSVGLTGLSLEYIIKNWESQDMQFI